MATTTAASTSIVNDLRRMSLEAKRTTAEMVESCVIAATLGSEQQVQCECCGMVEECTTAYISRVRGLHMGRWLCGLCSEAVKEEEGRRRRPGYDDDNVAGVAVEDALQAHMSMCMKFNRMRGSPVVADLAAAVRKALRRSIDGSCRSAPSSPRASTNPRRRSCLASISRGFEAPV